MNPSTRAGTLAPIALLRCFALLPVAAWAQSQSPPDPAAAQQAFGKHDARGRIDGKSAAGSAEDLLAMTETRRKAAIMALLDMGVDALPARDAVHAALEQADDASVPPDQRDALRARALLADLAIESGMTRDLARTRTRELASVVIGKAITSPVLRMDDLGPPLSGGGTALFEQNTVVGVVATCAPTVFVRDKPDRHPFAVAAYTRPMLAQSGRFASEPQAKAQ